MLFQRCGYRPHTGNTVATGVTPPPSCDRRRGGTRGWHTQRQALRSKCDHSVEFGPFAAILKNINIDCLLYILALFLSNRNIHLQQHPQESQDPSPDEGRVEATGINKKRQLPALPTVSHPMREVGKGFTH